LHEHFLKLLQIHLTVSTRRRKKSPLEGRRKLAFGKPFGFTGDEERMAQKCDLDEDALERWLAGALGTTTKPLEIVRFAAGQSNPTYRVGFTDRAYTLRRKPFGKLLPSAHAIDREYRILEALSPAGFPVPTPLAYCEDPSVIGTEFYLMDCVEGRVFRDNRLPLQTPEQRSAIYLELIGQLAELHSIDHRAIGLVDFERPGSYFERQVARWTKQYRSAQTDDIPEMECLIDYLPLSLPDEQGQALIHGDYRLENVMFAPERSEIAAVLDWELASIGDPLADLAYVLMNWVMPPEEPSSVSGIDFALSGIPTLEGALAHYCNIAGRSDVPELSWYFAYNLFRLAGILQGVKKRMIDGNAAGENAQGVVAMLPHIVSSGWKQARLAGA
jgi:aminoglycoside phosphotransferase (APT) family kinase protein